MVKHAIKQPSDSEICFRMLRPLVRIPHVPYIHLQSCLFDTGSITNKNDGGNIHADVTGAK